jgi:hypothetical protein
MIGYKEINDKVTMENDEFLKDLAKDLITELERKSDSYFSFGGNQEPMKNSDVLKEIRLLTPLGKEIIRNWLLGVKRNLDYLHRARLKTGRA